MRIFRILLAFMLMVPVWRPLSVAVVVAGLGMVLRGQIHLCRIRRFLLGGHHGGQCPGYLCHGCAGCRPCI